MSQKTASVVFFSFPIGKEKRQKVAEKEQKNIDLPDIVYRFIAIKDIKKNL